MEHDTLNLILLCAVILMSLIGIATLVIVAKIYSMHNVRNEEGEYSWMVPRKWMEFQETIVVAQERMVNTLNTFSENQIKMSKLLESLTNATLAMHESMNGGENGNKR